MEQEVKTNKQTNPPQTYLPIKTPLTHIFIMFCKDSSKLVMLNISAEIWLADSDHVSFKPITQLKLAPFTDSAHQISAQAELQFLSNSYLNVAPPLIHGPPPYLFLHASV